MLRKISFIFGLIALVGATALLVSCGKNEGGSGQTTATTANVCAAGQVYTYYGCLNQGFCPAGQGQNGNSCVPAMPTTNSGYNPGFYSGYDTGYNNSYYYGYGTGGYPQTYYSYPSTYNNTRCKQGSWYWYCI